METVEQAENTSAANPAPLPPTGWSRRSILFLGVIVLALVLGTLGWMWLAAAGRSAVVVETTGVECTGTKLVNRGGGRAESPIVVIWMRPGMDCTVSVEIRNDGRVGATLTSVRLPFMGPHAGDAVKADTLNGEPMDGPEGATDAVFDLDEKLAPGESFAVEFHLVFRQSGCDSQGGLLTAHELPTITVSSLGLSGARTTDSSLGFRGTADSSCSN